MVLYAGWNGGRRGDASARAVRGVLAVFTLARLYFGTSVILVVGVVYMHVVCTRGVLEWQRCRQELCVLSQCNALLQCCVSLRSAVPAKRCKFCTETRTLVHTKPS